MTLFSLFVGLLFAETSLLGLLTLETFLPLGELLISRLWSPPIGVFALCRR